MVGQIFIKNWNRYYAIGNCSKIILLIFLQLVIPVWRMLRVMTWDKNPRYSAHAHLSSDQTLRNIIQPTRTSSQEISASYAFNKYTMAGLIFMKFCTDVQLETTLNTYFCNILHSVVLMWGMHKFVRWGDESPARLPMTLGYYWRRHHL
jgi:hypothetical protein